DADGSFKGYDVNVTLHDLLRIPNRDRLFAVYEALKRGDSQATICQLTHFDPWFVSQIGEIIEFENNLTRLDAATLRQAKRLGFSDSQLARLSNARLATGGFEIAESDPLATRHSPLAENTIRNLRQQLAILPTYHQVDTCAAEFAAFT